MFGNLFGRKKNYLEVDLHSHLVPVLDDGVKDWKEALDLLKAMSALGFKKLITTPHIIHDYYPNTPDQIRQGVEQLNQLANEHGMAIAIEAGAEYFLDEWFLNSLKEGNELLSFGDNYLLIETAFMNKPIFLEEAIFEIKSRGLKPVLAHPERYGYLYEDMNTVRHLHDSGMLFQVNINSLTGYYSKEAKKMAQLLYEHKLIHFLGSDIHNRKHLEQIHSSIKSKLFQKCRQLPLLNSSL